MKDNNPGKEYKSISDLKLFWNSQFSFEKIFQVMNPPHT